MTRFSDPAAGFTLLELLVVLSLMALLTAVVPRFLPRTEGVELETRARAVAGLLERSRAQAIASARPVDVVIDLDRRRVDTTTGEAGEALPDWMDVEATTARGLVGSAGSAAIRFFADGSATGGRIILQAAGRSVDINVAWLTGAVTVADGVRQ